MVTDKLKDYHERLVNELNEVMTEKDELVKLEYRIRFSPMYLGFKMKKYWGPIDFFTMYFHIVMYFIVLSLTLFWWFNGSLIL